MEGIKEAIAFITGLAVKAEDPKTVNINGKTYCTKDLVRYDAPEKAAPISATTLTSLVDYIKENREELRDRMIIQVVNETKVLLYSGLLAERDRFVPYIAIASPLLCYAIDRLVFTDKTMPDGVSASARLSLPEPSILR